MNHDTLYRVKEEINITGDNETDYVMCWIATQGNTDSTPESSSEPNYSKKQKSVYAYYSTWARKHGLGYSYHCPDEHKDYDWVNTAKEKFRGWQKANSASIKNNKTPSSLKKEIYNYNGQSYIKVGPFNFTYTGSNPDVTFNITNQNWTGLSVLYGVYNGSTLEISSGFQAEDYSGKDFYLLVNTNSNATYLNLQVNLTDLIWNYSGTVSILQGDGINEELNKSWQNVIHLTAKYDETTVNQTCEMNNIPLTGELEITKQDYDTTGTLNNVGFVLYNKELGQYVASSSSNGIATYTSDRSQAKEFITGVDGNYGQITVIGLLPGNYEIYETKNPNYGYEEITSDKLVATVTIDPGTEFSRGVNDGQRTIADGYYELESALASNMVVEVQGGKSLDSTNVQLYNRNNSAAQQFYVEYVGNGYYIIRSAGANNKVLDVEGGSADSGANVQIYTSNDSIAQRWFISDAGGGYYYIINQAGWKYLDVYGGNTANGTNIQVYNGNERNSQKFKLNSKDTSSLTQVTISNAKQTGNMRIQKTDATNSSAMSGIRFKIRNTAGEYIVAVDNSGRVQSTVTGTIHLGNMQTTTNVNSATEFVTSNSGVVDIYNLKADTYQVLETSIGNNYYGYELDEAYISWSSNMGSGTGATSSIYVNRQTSSDTSESASGRYDVLTVKNRRKYVKISGYVWEDVAWDDGKNQDSNQLYQAVNDDRNDKLLNNIVVRLKDSNGSTIQEVRTNSSGKYTFNNVIIDNLSRYYIEFSYNGMAYESVDIINISNNRGTKAIEGSNRTTFNANFAQITTGQSNNSNGTKTNDIRYNTGNYTSTINYEGTYQYGYDASQVKYMTADEYRTYYPVNGVASKYLITSSTYNAYRSVGRSGYLSDIINANSIRQSGTTEIGTTFTSGINLGLKKRERPDLSVVKDVESATVSIVGTQHVYKYGDRFNPDLWAENSNGVSGHELDPRVKFEEKYAEMTYSRPLYASDVYYTGDQGDPLSIQLTYKIGVRNNSTGLNANIYELDDYFDSKYNLIAIGTDINADGSIKSGTQITNYTSPTNVNSEYKKITIGGNNRVILELGPLEEKYVYVQLQINRSDIIQIVENSNSENSKLDNITEIKKYGITKTNSNGVKEIYAGIDKDSQPGNTDINNRATWEDDTDKAPGMLLVLQQQRQVNGKVFLDIDENSVGDGQQLHTAIARQGNGYYDNDEKGIENVKVSLIDEDGNIVQVYNDSSRQYEDAVTYTNENGEYTLGGFIPGKYVVQYTWGGNVDGAGLNSIYTLDSGEEEIVNVQNYKSTIVNENVWNAKGTNEKWYSDDFKRNYLGLEWNSSSNREIRTSDAVDDYDTRLAIDSEAKEMTYSEKQKFENTYDSTSTEEKYTNIQMNSKTHEFAVYIENGDTASGITNAGGNTTNYSKDTVNRINSIDLGIIERARQILELEKNIKSVKITLANGNILVNANLNENGELVDFAQYVTVIPKSPAANGQINVQVDEELLQSATVEIDYELKVINTSELEYQTEEFYNYGVGHGEVASETVTLRPTLIIDYLNENLALDMNYDDIWDAIGKEERKEQLINSGLLSGDLEDVLLDTERVETTDELQGEALVPVGLETSDGTRKSSAIVDLKAYRLLSGNGEETYTENNAEIIKVIKDKGGAILVTTPGNYNPNDLSTSEPDDAISQSVLIIPPTGLNTNYIAYILLTISSLGILVSGIILIKKFVIGRRSNR